jgi:hypothetical protein
VSKIADDAEAIARRLKELEADRQLALTGSTVEEKPAEKPQEFDSYGMYLSGYSNQLSSTGTGNGSLGGIDRPQWPYAGTAHEWRGVVKMDDKTKAEIAPLCPFYGFIKASD